MAKKQYPVIVDAENKIIFPSAEQFISANPELGLPEQISVEYGMVSINTTGNIPSSNSNIYLEGDQTSIRGSSTFIRGYDEVSISALSTKIHGEEGVSIESDAGITFNNVINTNGIHEQNVYTSEPNFSCKGWYLASNIFNPYDKYPPSEFIKDPNLNINCVLLSDERVPFETAKNRSGDSEYSGFDKNSKILSELEHGDILTFKNDWNFINAIEVDYVEGNRLWFKYIAENIPETYAPYMYDLQEYGDHVLGASVRCFNKPDAGYIEFGGINSTSIGGGSNTSRGYLSTTIGGRRNINNADFTTVIGEDNRADGKSSFIIGNANTLLQEECGIAGHRNSIAANVRQGFIFGGNNTINQENTVLVGRGLTRNKQNTSLTGVYAGRFNNPEEDGAFVVGTGQGSNDLYNSVVIDRSSCTYRGKQTFEIYTSGDSFTSEHGIIALGSNNDISKASSSTYMLGGGLLRDTATSTGTRTIVGVFNADVSGNATFVVGAGTSATARKNIIEAYPNAVNINGKLTTKELICNGTSIGFGSNTTVSSGTYALGAGLKQTTSIGSQVIVGVFNKETVKDATYGNPVFTVGKGFADNNRSNAIEVYRNLTKINNDVNINGNLTTNAFTTSNFSTNNISISNSDNSEFCKLTNNSLLFKYDLTLSGDDINKDEVLLTRDKLVFTGQEETPMGTFAPGHIRIYDRGYASFEVKSIGFDSYSDGRMQLTMSDGEVASSEIGSGTIKIEPTSIVITELTGKEGDYGKIFNKLTITPTNISSSNLSFNINGYSTSDDAKSNSIEISNSNGLTIAPALAAQLKHKVGNVHIDGTSISINPAGDSHDWNIGQNYPELFECGHQLKMTNKEISLYDEYNNLTVSIDAYGIRGNKNNWTNFSFTGNNIYLKGTEVDGSADSNTSLDAFGISSKNSTTIGTCTDDYYIPSNILLYYARTGIYGLNGILTSKNVYKTTDNTVAKPTETDYTEVLLDKLTTKITGERFNPETEEYEYTYATGDTTNFEKTAVGLDYFYNVIKELNARIKELESQTSNQDQESVRLKIKGTNEYCTVTAEKDSNGNITLSVENA